jgi:hypothetical protein
VMATLLFGHTRAGPVRTFHAKSEQSSKKA